VFLRMLRRKKADLLVNERSYPAELLIEKLL
jgi:hypothetical protein